MEKGGKVKKYQVYKSLKWIKESLLTSLFPFFLIDIQVCVETVGEMLGSFGCNVRGYFECKV